MGRQHEQRRALEQPVSESAGQGENPSATAHGLGVLPAKAAKRQEPAGACRHEHGRQDSHRPFGPMQNGADRREAAEARDAQGDEAGQEDPPRHQGGDLGDVGRRKPGEGIEAQTRGGPAGDAEAHGDGEGAGPGSGKQSPSQPERLADELQHVPLEHRLAQIGGDGEGGAGGDRPRRCGRDRVGDVGEPGGLQLAADEQGGDGQDRHSDQGPRQPGAGKPVHGFRRIRRPDRQARTSARRGGGRGRARRSGLVSAHGSAAPPFSP